MSAFSTFMGDTIINHILRNISFGSPTTVYAALFTGSTDLATLRAGTHDNEISNSGTGYVRKAVTFGAPSTRVASNSADVIFDQATADWPGTVTYCAIVSTATYGGGDIYFAAALTTPRTVLTGSTFKFKTGDLIITLD